MKVPLSRSEGGGGGLLVRAIGTAALAAVLAISTGTALAGAAEQPTGPIGPNTSTTARPTLKVTIIGDSFTAGEGSNSTTYKTVPVEGMNEDGTTSTSMVISPQHQSSTAPTLQALNQIQAANPGVDIQVTFVPVSGATRDSLYEPSQPGTPFEQPPQIDAVRGADVVIVGIGGNDAKFGDWVRSVLGSTDTTSAQQFPKFMQQLNDGTYLNNQVTLLNKISDLASPNATIISLGYPKAFPATVPGTMDWWSPFSWSTISQGEANMSNQLGTTLNTNNQDASFIAGGQHPAQQWLYADVSTALQGHELFTNQEGLNGLTPSNEQGSYHPNDLGYQLDAAALQPYIQQGINGQLQRLGVQGAVDVPPVTPTFANMWNLRVDVPLQVQKQQQQANPPSGDKSQTPTDQPAQTEQPAQTPSDQQTDQGAKQPDGSDQATPAQQPDGSRPDTSKPAAAPPEGPQPDGTQPKSDATQPEATKPDAAPSDGAKPDATPPDGSGAAQPDGADATSPDGADVARPTAPGSDGTQPDGTQPDAVSPDASQPAAADHAGAAPPDGADAQPATDGSAATPDGAAATPADQPAAPADQSAAPPDGVDAQPAPADQPAAPAAPADTPAAPADTPAAPADTPAAPAAPADTPPAPVDTPTAPADTPAAPVDVPAAPPPAPAPVIVPDPAPVIAPPPPPPPPPPPVITPPEIPTITPVNPVDSGSSSLSSDSGLDSIDGLGSDTGDSGLDSGLDSGGFDSGGGVGGDSGGGD